jgi:hypothetical protein
MEGGRRLAAEGGYRRHVAAFYSPPRLGEPTSCLSGADGVNVGPVHLRDVDLVRANVVDQQSVGVHVVPAVQV